MKLSMVYIRFYKSFNFDQLRKARDDVRHEDWDFFDGRPFPYVRVSLDSDITTVVGANESGKTHLLTAISKGITGQDIDQVDLCRYCEFFSVQEGAKCWPHIGLAWSEISAADAQALGTELGIPDAKFTHFLMFRETPDTLAAYIPDDKGGFTRKDLNGPPAQSFGSTILPQPVSIDPKVALPNSISIEWLGKQTDTSGVWSNRKVRARALNDMERLRGFYTSDAATFTQRSGELHSMVSGMYGPQGYVNDHNQREEEAQRQLARALLIKLAEVDPDKLILLSEALANEKDGYATGIVAGINSLLAKRLNLKKWWVQDRDFSLELQPREFDLVFTVRDRTGTSYSFSERSSGLKYFLSYLIQALTRDRSPNNRTILTMDEPDTFLSAEAQQDLLKVFNSYAFPDDGTPPVQVVFVTHSPFLIDKNFSHRIRVLEKGVGLDGTRVIGNASQNHYEPLRSAFGAFVGETAFVGATNLLVEGAADQIILAGIARLTRDTSKLVESETLDLNRIVLVPCGSAGQIPYMAYLIRGRDKEKPSVIALLDKDESGDEALKQLKTSEKMGRLLEIGLVMQLNEPGIFSGASPEVIEIEDLLPLPLAVAAANHLFQEVAAFRDGEPPTLLDADVLQFKIEKGLNMFDALEAAAKAKGARIEKIGFARAVVEVCTDRRSAPDGLQAEIDVFLGRMRRLFTAINKRVRKAEQEARREQIGSKVKRHVDNFLRDYPKNVSKERLGVMFEGVETILDNSEESDRVRDQVRVIKRDSVLEENVFELVADFPKVREMLGMLHRRFDVDRLKPA